MRALSEKKATTTELLCVALCVRAQTEKKWPLQQDFIFAHAGLLWPWKLLEPATTKCKKRELLLLLLLSLSLAMSLLDWRLLVVSPLSLFPPRHLSCFLPSPKLLQFPGKATLSPPFPPPSLLSLLFLQDTLANRIWEVNAK